ncbi:MAG: hypothetical protein QOG21_2527 [Actinomycetota bacterium]|jgi:hypothetical protein|nr:hypothetical protein [Actinomycetota bacterium]
MRSVRQSSIQRTRCAGSRGSRVGLGILCNAVTASMVHTIHMSGEISERFRRDIGEMAHSLVPKRPPDRVCRASPRHLRYSV